MKNKFFVTILALCLLLAACEKENDSPQAPSFEERLAAIYPYQPPEAPERYYDGSVAEFIAYNDYGRVYPYVGKVQTVLPAIWDEHIYFHWLPDNCLYGFVDQNGRIICDPVYNSAELLTCGNKAAYVVRKTVLPQ